MKLAPIISFSYNRPNHLRRTIDALKVNVLASESELYMFVDGPKPDASDEQRSHIEEVRAIARATTGFRSVHLTISENNKGCARSIIEGVTEVIRRHGRAIIVEDDIVTHPHFLRFMNEALDCYQNDSRIFTIGGFTYHFPELDELTDSVFLAHRTCSWGWATWANRWALADWQMPSDSRHRLPRSERMRLDRGGIDLSHMLHLQMNCDLDAWDIMWEYTVSRHDGLCLRPTKSLVQNIGNDASGVHCLKDNHTIKLYNSDTYSFHLPNHIQPNPVLERAFANLYSIGPIRPKTFLYFLYRLTPWPIIRFAIYLRQSQRGNHPLSFHK